MIDHSNITRRSRAAARRRLLGLLAGAYVIALPASALAATNVSHVVQQYTVSPDSMCGLPGASYWLWNFATGPTAHGITFEAGRVSQTFVADNGRSVKISYAAGVIKIDPTVYYPDGSSSISVVEDGLNVKAQALDGRLLEQSTGRLSYTYFFDANGDFVSLVIDSASGPENNVTGMPDCSVIGPYLAGS